MNNPNTPKIVVGVGLAALYASGLAYFVLRDRPDAVIVDNTAATPAQISPEPASLPPPALESGSAENSTGMADQSAAMVSSVAPQAGINATTRNAPPRDEAGDRQPARMPAAAPSVPVDTGAPSPIEESGNSRNELAETGEAAPSAPERDSAPAGEGASIDTGDSGAPDPTITN